MVGDALASLAVVIAGVVLLFDPSATWLDPASALVVAAHHRQPGRRRVPGQHRRPPRVDPVGRRPRRATDAMAEVPGVSEVHDLHVWSLSSEMRVLSAHLVLTRPSHPRGGPDRRGPGEGGHRRAVRHLPQHPRARVRAVQRRGRPVSDGARRSRPRLGPPPLNPMAGPTEPRRADAVAGRDAAPSNRTAETAPAPRGHVHGGPGLHPRRAVSDDPASRHRTGAPESTRPVTGPPCRSPTAPPILCRFEPCRYSVPCGPFRRTFLRCLRWSFGFPTIDTVMGGRSRVNSRDAKSLRFSARFLGLSPDPAPDVHRSSPTPGRPARNLAVAINGRPGTDRPRAQPSASTPRVRHADE